MVKWLRNLIRRGGSHTPTHTIEPYCLKAVGDPPVCPFADDDDRWIAAPAMGHQFRRVCRRCKVQKG